jgi:pentapeptide MXKDX repeat protein
MKFRTLILTTAVLATASGYAFAQSSPTERTGSKTDTHQSQQQMQKDKMTKPSTTGSGMTGSGMSGSGMTGSGTTSDKANGQLLNKNVSPASPEAGDKQQK